MQSLFLFLDCLGMFSLRPTSNPSKINHFLFNELSVLQMNYVLSSYLDKVFKVLGS